MNMEGKAELGKRMNGFNVEKLILFVHIVWNLVRKYKTSNHFHVFNTALSINNNALVAYINETDATVSPFILL